MLDRGEHLKKTPPTSKKKKKMLFTVLFDNIYENLRLSCYSGTMCLKTVKALREKKKEV